MPERAVIAPWLGAGRRQHFFAERGESQAFPDYREMAVNSRRKFGCCKLRVALQSRLASDLHLLS